MKTLYLIRHAKSSWKTEGQDDYDRPLNNRGERDAPLMAAVMKHRKEIPQLLLSSSACRAQQTAQAFAAHLAGENPELVFEKKLYLAGSGTILEIVNHLEDRFDTVAIFAHNPGMSNAVEYFSNEVVDMPTTGIVRIDFGVDSWKEVSGSTGMFRYFDYPKKHIVL
jgi:phosphohistidine phosphatase